MGWIYFYLVFQVFGAGLLEKQEIPIFKCVHYKKYAVCTYLLCSDGLSNMVEDTELCRLIQQEKKLHEAGGRLILEANRNGGTDNIAVVLVEIE